MPIRSPPIRINCKHASPRLFRKAICRFPPHKKSPLVASKGGDCIGLIARSDEKACAASADCIERETKAWLALALDLNREPLAGRNRAAVAVAVAGIEKQARATCMAAAALSAWGRDQVAKGKQRIGLDHPCMRDAVAGLVMPLLGYMRGV